MFGANENELLISRPIRHFKNDIFDALYFGQTMQRLQ